MRKRSLGAVAILALSLAAIAGAPAAYGAQFYSSGGRADFYADGDGVRANEAPDLVLLTRVPSMFDPSIHTLSLTCSLMARTAEFVAISKVRARHSSTLVVLDPTSGTYSTHRLGSGKTKTGNPGTAFAIDVEPSVLLGSVPEGTVLMAETSFRLTNKKVTNGLTVLCDIGLRVAP